MKRELAESEKHDWKYLRFCMVHIVIATLVVLGAIIVRIFAQPTEIIYMVMADVLQPIAAIYGLLWIILAFPAIYNEMRKRYEEDE